MNRSLLAMGCVLSGCVIGATLPSIHALSLEPNPNAPRWDMFCENVGNLGSPGEARTTAVARINQSLAARGKEGFELVATPVATIGKTGSGGGVSGEMLMCFKRLAAH